MPKFAPRISQDQRAALVAYALQPGSSARAAWRAARDGKLAGGPFELSYTRTAELVAAEREQRNGERAKKIARKGAGAAVDEMLGDLLNVTHREVRQLRNRPSNQPVDTERVRRCARALRELRLAAATAGAAGPSMTSATIAQGSGERERTLLEQLAGDAADGRPSTASHQDAQDTQRDAPIGMAGEAERSDAQEATQTEEAGEAVRSSAVVAEPAPPMGV